MLVASLNVDECLGRQVIRLRLSLNDMYMATLMTGWMLVFMGCVSSVGQVPTGGCIVASSLYSKHHKTVQRFTMSLLSRYDQLWRQNSSVIHELFS
jgi:hypothetical protein